MQKLKLRPVGGSIGMVVPTRGDELYAVEPPDGYLLTPHNPEVRHQLNLAREIMRRRRMALRALAKRTNVREGHK
jgi:hypothetical protein